MRWMPWHQRRSSEETVFSEWATMVAAGRGGFQYIWVLSWEPNSQPSWFRGLWPICSSLRTHQFSCFWGPMVYPNIIWSNQKILTCLPFPNHFFPESMSSWEGFVQICWKKGVGTIYPTFEMVYPCLLCLFFNGNWPSSYNPRSIPRSLGFWDDFVGSTGPKRSEP